MSDVLLKPFTPKGEITPPPSKSDVHRAIICASLCKGTSTVSSVIMSDDIKATISCMRSLGADIKDCGDTLYITGDNIFENRKAELHCNESGSTLRFLIPLASAGNVNTIFTGSGRLPKRPIGIYLDILPDKGITCKTEGSLPLEVSGQLKGGTFTLPGNISSQFITGLLFSLPLLDEDSDIILTSDIESTGYIDMTIDTMKRFGVTVERSGKAFHIKGKQEYKATQYKTESDFSQAAFFLVAGALKGEICVKNLNTDSYQGDKKILEILKDAGADIKIQKDRIYIKESSLKPLTIDASQIPDLVPVLAVLLSKADGTSKIINAKRLRLKESDRLMSTRQLIEDLGGTIEELDDGLIITGVKSFKGNRVTGYNDHRIVMSGAVCACMSDNDITVTDSQSINKSYPGFFDDYNSIGGHAQPLTH